MRLTIQENIETVGWNEGIAKAPQDVVDFALKSSGEGIPTAFGTVLSPTNEAKWVIIQSGEKPYVGYRQK